MFIAIILPLIALRTWRRHRRNRSTRGGEGESFDVWVDRDFATWQGRLPGAEAAAKALLPIASVAFGMAAFALVVHLAA
jgi:hypothetical protein